MGWDTQNYQLNSFRSNELNNVLSIFFADTYADTYADFEKYEKKKISIMIMATVSISINNYKNY